MFESLDQQIAADEKRAMSASKRLWLWLFVALISALVFGGLYSCLRMFA